MRRPDGPVVGEQQFLPQPFGLVTVVDYLRPHPVGFLDVRLGLGGRLVAVAAQALTASGRESAAEHVAVVRNWDSFTLLVTPQPLAAHQLRAVRAFAERHGFDLVALPGLRAGETNRFSRLAEPFHAQAVAAVLDPARAGAPGAGW